MVHLLNLRQIQIPKLEQEVVEMDLIKLSKIISLALRHTPAKYDMVLDNQGWGSLNTLIKSISHHHDEYAEVTVDNLVSAVNVSAKKRHEINGERIRALYGHTIGTPIEKINTIPPEFLYHGTSSSSLKKIKVEGLKKMSRQYVHLSSNIEQATQVAVRKTTNPIILKINALQASNTGVFFYKETNVWLCDFVSASFIEIQM